MPRLTALSPDDVMIAARTVYGEARGESFAGKLAVAWVIRTRAELARRFRQQHGRAHPLFGDGSLARACRVPRQFSCWNDNDRNRPLLEDLVLPVALLDSAFRDALGALLQVIDGRADDPTGGATHYHAAAMTPPPAWAARQAPAASIGGHVFFTNIA